MNEKIDSTNHLVGGYRDSVVLSLQGKIEDEKWSQDIDKQREKVFIFVLSILSFLFFGMFGLMIFFIGEAPPKLPGVIEELFGCLPMWLRLLVWVIFPSYGANVFFRLSASLRLDKGESKIRELENRLQERKGLIALIQEIIEFERQQQEMEKRT